MTTPPGVTPDVDLSSVGVLVGCIAACFVGFSILIMIAGKGRGR